MSMIAQPGLVICSSSKQMETGPFKVNSICSLWFLIWEAITKLFLVSFNQFYLYIFSACFYFSDRLRQPGESNQRIYSKMSKLRKSQKNNVPMPKRTSDQIFGFPQLPDQKSKKSEKNNESLYAIRYRSNKLKSSIPFSNILCTSI